MKKEIKLAVVGYGAGGAGRGHNLLKLAVEGVGGIQAVAVCDILPDSLEKAKKEFPQAGLFDNFDEMLKTTSIDALLIETPANYHAELAVKALNKNINVLSDIPTVDSVEEGNKLWEAHKNSESIYMTGANANLSGFVQSAVDLKRAGLLGEPYYMEAEYVHDCREYWEITPWRKPSAANPRMPIQYCTHSIGPLLRLIDEDFEWVSCFDTGSHINNEEEQHDAMAALFRTRSNIVVRLMTSFINNVRTGHHGYRIHGTKGYFEHMCGGKGAGGKRTFFSSTELEGAHNIELPVSIPPEYAKKIKELEAGGIPMHGGLDYMMLNLFFNAVANGLPSPISLREGLRMTLPGIYAAESAKRGGELVKIKYPWNNN